MHTHLHCIGAFPLFPSWMFFEECVEDDTTRIHAFGPGGRHIHAASRNREFAVAECVREILKAAPPPDTDNRLWPPRKDRKGRRGS